jgi:selenocysteine lyase/cysteine desulfurase
MADDARSRFWVPEGGPYALSHSVGCLPRSAAAALDRAYLEPWRREGGDGWNAWLAAIDGFRAGLARLLGGASADYCPQTNLSAALSKLMPAIPRSKRCRVFVTTEDAFPSLGFVLDRAAPFGFERRLIPREEDPSDPNTWDRALGKDIAAVLVTHVHSNTGVRTPVAEIARMCREREIFCAVDIAQSAGILDFSVPQLGADVVLGSCVKWLCGGPGAGFLWVDPQRVAELEPTDVGWFSHAEPFAFDIASFAFAPDARRFWGGTPSVAPCALATESLKELADIGIATIERHNRALCREFLAHAPGEHALAIDFDRIGGTLCLHLGSRCDAVVGALRAAGARFDTRGDTVRLSFHIYNTAEEAARLGDACHAGS